jgi:ribosome-associated protein
MAGRKKRAPVDQILELAINAVLDKKGINPVVLDFRELKGAICEAFLICHGQSRVQVDAITDHVVGEIKKHTGQHPTFVEGQENSEWVLIDYFDLVIHIFQEPRRKFYNLEQLWADAKIRMISEEPKTQK